MRWSPCRKAQDTEYTRGRAHLSLPSLEVHSWRVFEFCHPWTGACFTFLTVVASCVKLHTRDWTLCNLCFQLKARRRQHVRVRSSLRSQGRKTSRSRTTAPSVRNRGVPKNVVRKDHLEKTYESGRRDRCTDLVRKPTRRRPTRFRKAESSFSDHGRCS